MIRQVWQEAHLKPHRLDRYLASDDPQFEQKAADIIGLYLNPPQHAAIFYVDEKSAIQALDRLDRLDRRLPLSPGRALGPDSSFLHRGNAGSPDRANSPRRHTAEHSISHNQSVKQNCAKMSDEHQE